MKFSRSVILAAVVLVAVGLSGAVSLIARAETGGLPALPGKPGAPPLLVAKQVRIPDCSNQDQDDDNDDRDEVKSGKPDTDDIELECGDQDDDDNEVEDEAPGKHHEREKTHEKHDAPHVTAAKKVSGK